MLLIYIGAACTHQCSNTQSAASHRSSSTLGWVTNLHHTMTLSSNSWVDPSDQPKVVAHCIGGLNHRHLPYAMRPATLSINAALVSS